VSGEISIANPSALSDEIAGLRVGHVVGDQFKSTSETTVTFRVYVHGIPL
jgi:hypothetical protein